MPKPKGSPKVGGRRRGTPNKSTEQLRQFFQCFLENNLETLQADFDRLTPRERLNFIDRVARIVLPPFPSDDFKTLERLLVVAPDRVVDQISEKVLKMYNENSKKNEQSN